MMIIINGENKETTDGETKEEKKLEEAIVTRRRNKIMRRF